MLAIDNIRFGIGLDMGICILSENYILWGLRFGGFGKKCFWSNDMDDIGSFCYEKLWVWDNSSSW